MIPCVKARAGVKFDVIEPGGFALLGAFALAARDLEQDFIITSGTDGEHSGPLDPHKLGRAYDLHSKSFENKEAAILTVLRYADASVAPFPLDGGFATTYFFMWLEDAGTANEHYHAQVRHGVVYPPIEPDSSSDVNFES
jgi:hypothetical protein